MTPRRAGLLCAALAVAACARPPATPIPERIQRLLPALGPAEFLSLDGETRPATRLAAGEARQALVSVAPGSRLLFGVGVLEGAPSEGLVELRVRAGEQELLREPVALGRRRWLNRSLRFEAGGEITLEFGVPGRAGSGTPFLAIGAPRVLPPRPLRRPRVLVWISQDTLRADHLGSYGYERDTAPNFTRLGRGWTLFEDAVSPAPWTLPSLASQMTSRYPSFHGATHRSKAADTRYASLFEALAADGFTVLGVTGNPFVSAKYALARGFDALVYTGRRADVVSRLARDLVGQQRGDGDLALFVHYMDPHDPFNPPEPYDTRFGEPYAGEVTGYNHRSAAKTEADVAHVKALYDGEIAYTDSQIAALFESLGPRVLMSQAVIAYTSDHGEELMDHGGWGHAHTLYQELVHVPFALRIPGAPSRRIDTPVSLVDLAPTLLDALGVEAPVSFQGRSLLPSVRGEALQALPIFAESSRAKSWHKLSVREGRFKYVAHFAASEGDTRGLKREALYDLLADPAESEGSAAGPELVRMRREAEAFLERARTAGVEAKPAALDPAEDEELRALGYVD